MVSFHAQGMVHRDIKPSNILISRSEKDNLGTAKLADFGLSKCITEAGGPTITKSGEFAGSIYYTAPEQILHFSKVGPPADVYSVGVSLYELLSGDFPYVFEKNKDPILVVLEAPTISINEKVKQIPSGFAEIIDSAIQKNQKARISGSSFLLRLKELA